MKDSYRIVEKKYSDENIKFFPELLIMASLSGHGQWGPLDYQGYHTYQEALNVIKTNEYRNNTEDTIHNITEKDLE